MKGTRKMRLEPALLAPFPFLLASGTSAQELDPRADTPAPVGVF